MHCDKKEEPLWRPRDVTDSLSEIAGFSGGTCTEVDDGESDRTILRIGMHTHVFYTLLLTDRFSWPPSQVARAV